jgi:outer membrane biogenesis lipoprotein LolB
MKTHILFAILTALFLTACASHEGRSISSTQDQQEQERDAHRALGNANREIGPQ